MNIEINKSKRKTVSLVLKNSELLVVFAPLKMSKTEILHFIEMKKTWIEKNRQMLRNKEETLSKIEPLSKEEIENVKNKARQEIPKIVEYYARIIGVDYGRISFRMQKTRWGSCSSKGNLNFNYALAIMPIKVRDYVVIHELCHRRYMDHSKKFWDCVSEFMPDYKQQILWLKENGRQISKKLDVK